MPVLILHAQDDLIIPYGQSEKVSTKVQLKLVKYIIVLGQVMLCPQNKKVTIFLMICVGLRKHGINYVFFFSSIKPVFLCIFLLFLKHVKTIALSIDIDIALLGN